MATSSTRFTNLNYWINEKTGFDYLVQIQVPPLRIDKPEDLEELPLESVNPVVPLMVRDVLKDGRVHTSVRPGEYDRDMSQRYLTVVANVEGEDMGRAANQVRQAVKDAGDAAPRRARRGDGPAPVDDPDVRGAGDRAGGLRVRHPRAPDGVFPVPAAGADLDRGRAGSPRRDRRSMLYFTGTTLNIESFMGSIMCLGVSVSNSVMMVTFMDEHWKAGKPSDRGGHPGRERTSAADLDDGLRDDRRHGADGAGAGARAARWRPRSAGR